MGGEGVGGESVDFVADEVDGVLVAELHESDESLRRVALAEWVVRVAEEEGSDCRAVRFGFEQCVLVAFHCAGERELVLAVERCVHAFDTGAGAEVVFEGLVARSRDQNAVARREDREPEHLAETHAAIGDDQVVCLHIVDGVEVAVHMPCQGGAELPAAPGSLVV